MTQRTDFTSTIRIIIKVDSPESLSPIITIICKLLVFNQIHSQRYYYIIHKASTSAIEKFGWVARVLYSVRESILFARSSTLLMDFPLLRVLFLPSLTLLLSKPVHVHCRNGKCPVYSSLYTYMYVCMYTLLLAAVVKKYRRYLSLCNELCMGGWCGVLYNSKFMHP